MLRDMDAHDLSWVVHVGDIFDSPCTDDHYRTALDRFNGLRHPVVYTPGDNEWTDCWEPGSGSFAPRERLTSLRKIFFADPHQSLGGRRVPLATQADHREFSEFVENVAVVACRSHVRDRPSGRQPQRPAPVPEAHSGR